MTSTISVRLSKLLQEELSRIEKKWHTDRSEVIRRLLAEAIQQWKIENSLEQLSKNKISIGKASEECGVSIWEMIDLIKEKNISWPGYSEKDLEEDLRILEKK
ncbi:MAG: hypothetical protein CL811_01240 [Colwelliaceae bacterium]|nr:hypothetical protein [Colwelliaceae bacterium]|tara:strand:+ start:197 stop:505 length:309 start_codon:yes stop_codon:yes gene_type:complete